LIVSLATAGFGGCATTGPVCPPAPPPAAVAVPPAADPSSPVPETEDEKKFYAVGQMLGRNVGVFRLSPRELAIVVGGLSDTVLKRPQRVDLEAYGPKVNALAESRAKASGEEQAAAGKSFREKAAKEAGATTLSSGVIYRTEAPGTGDSPTASAARVKVHYEGKLITGEVFDSSRRRGEPATFPLSGVISCWTEGVGRMKVGERAVLVCPPETAYGAQGRPPTIPGQATLIFEVELLGIDATPAPASGAPR
jgi:FKBP-type peptidyl-prolyl cis-trans isomerase FkpA